MKTITISNSGNGILIVTAKELSEIVKIDGLDKIEVLDKNGWDYIENKMVDVNFKWNKEKPTIENVTDFLLMYSNYINKPSREDDFGEAVRNATK